jgi:hypothetical protein
LQYVGPSSSHDEDNIIQVVVSGFQRQLDGKNISKLPIDVRGNRGDGGPMLTRTRSLFSLIFLGLLIFGSGAELMFSPQSLKNMPKRLTF